MLFCVAKVGQYDAFLPLYFPLPPIRRLRRGTVAFRIERCFLYTVFALSTLTPSGLQRE